MREKRGKNGRWIGYAENQGKKLLLDKRNGDRKSLLQSMSKVWKRFFEIKRY